MKFLRGDCLSDGNNSWHEAADRGALFDARASKTSDGIMVMDEAGLVLFYNQACETLFQYEPRDVIGQNVKMLMPAPYRNENDGYIARYKTTREPHIIE